MIDKFNERIAEISAINGETLFKVYSPDKKRVILVDEKDHAVNPKIRENLDKILRKIEDYEPNSSISKNINMIFVDEHDGLRETYHSNNDKVFGKRTKYILDLYFAFINKRYRDPHFNIYNKDCLFGKKGTQELYDSKNEIQV